MWVGVGEGLCHTFLLFAGGLLELVGMDLLEERLDLLDKLGAPALEDLEGDLGEKGVGGDWGKDTACRGR